MRAQCQGPRPVALGRARPGPVGAVPLTGVPVRVTQGHLVLHILDGCVHVSTLLSWLSPPPIPRLALQELVEAVVLPMTHAERFKAIGIKPPKGVLLYGPPGTGKTLLARACARQTDAVFLKLAGPQLVQMFIGDGAKVRATVWWWWWLRPRDLL